MVLGYFLGGWDTPTPQKTKKSPTIIFFYFFFAEDFLGPLCFGEDFLGPLMNFALMFLSPLGAQPLEARGEATITYIK